MSDKKQGTLERAADALDFTHRDPNNLNAHVQVNFDDIIGEPEGAHTPNPVWPTSLKAFLVGKLCCHYVLSYLCAVPCSFMWGMFFSCISFSQIYHCTPSIRAFNMLFECPARLYSTLVHCWCDAANESCSLIFTKIFVNSVAPAQTYKHTTYGPMKQMNQLAPSPELNAV